MLHNILATRMAQVKLFETYDDANESFDSYLERLNAYYMAMNIGQCDDDAAAPVAKFLTLE